MKTSPKDQLRGKWKTKQAAADAIVALIGDPDGKTKQRLKRASNQQLLELYAAGLTLKEKFQTRENLEKAIFDIQFPKGNVDEGYRAKVRKYGVKRLLDTYRQLGTRS